MKKLVSLLLCAGFCMGLAVPGHAAGKTYEEAVAELQSGDCYTTEETFDSDYGTVFMYDHGPNPNGQHGFLTLITKAPCARGEGAVIGLPQPRNSLFCYVKPPHAADLSGDGKSFTYSYHYDHPVLSGEGEFLRPAGDFNYSVDLTTGEVTESYTPLGYEKTLSTLTQAEGYVVDELLESPAATAVLRHQEFPAANGDPAYRDYQLYLVFKDDNATEAFCRLLLPSTVYLPHRAYAPTGRAPDASALCADGKTLTYTYFFDVPLSYGDTVYHEAGTYTYIVDTVTGKQEVTHTSEIPSPPQLPFSVFSDVPAGSWFETGVALCAEKGVMVGTGGGAFSPERELSQAECLTLAFRLYDLMWEEEHVIEKAPGEGKLILTLADGTVLEGYGPYTDGENAVFGWWVSPMGTRQAVYAIAPGWLEHQEIPDQVKAQQAWLDAHPELHDHGVPATLTLDGVTYQGTTDCWMPVGPFVFQFNPEPEKAEEVNSILYDAVYRKAAPAPWWQDTAYTITQRGLEDIFDPADFSDLPASRGFFARLIADACEGHLDQINIVTAIPDLPREKDNTTADTYREAAYSLYEAGILTGVDQAGTFAAGNTLTRAEAAVMAARALDPSLRVQTASQETQTFDYVLSDLRNRFGYHNERLFDTDVCTVVVNDYGGMMHAQTGVITIIYKSGSAKGEGAILNPPHPGNNYSPLLSRNPDSMELSADGRSFTYSYHFDEPLVYTGQVIRAAGDFVYTVDLASGEVTENIPTVPEEVNTYAAVLERTLAEYAENGYVVEQTIEAPLCTLIFHYFPIEDGTRSYFLDLIYKTDMDADVSGNIWHISEGRVEHVSLPITGNDGSGQLGYPVYYTARMPDAMSLSEDGNTFALTYNECYYGSPYTQTIDLRTGMYDGE